MIKIFKQKAGVISEQPCWIGMYGCWMHIEDSFPRLVFSLIKEWKSDKNLAM